MSSLGDGTDDLCPTANRAAVGIVGRLRRRRHVEALEVPAIVEALSRMLVVGLHAGSCDCK